MSAPRKGPSQYASGINVGFSIGVLVTNIIWIVAQAVR